MSEPATPQLRSVTNALSGIEVDIVADPADMYLQSQLAAPDNFEPVVSVARRILASDAVVLDVGACLGFVSAAMSQVLPAGRVVAVEAGPHLIEGLRSTAARARGASVHVVHAAVGATSGRSSTTPTPTVARGAMSPLRAPVCALLPLPISSPWRSEPSMTSWPIADLNASTS